MLIEMELKFILISEFLGNKLCLSNSAFISVLKKHYNFKVNFFRSKLLCIRLIYISLLDFWFQYWIYQ